MQIVGFPMRRLICNHSPPRPGGGRGIAMEMSGALTRAVIDIGDIDESMEMSRDPDIDIEK